ncbi:hypothetical protein Scep_029668 [Stephania cephalantha]|uniref:Uncharacterized protein n=1 Tax=Stephania cephalantha TaxID=152367 RepID=A0AAP0E1Q1_9MAGN
MRRPCRSPSCFGRARGCCDRWSEAVVDHTEKVRQIRRGLRVLKSGKRNTMIDQYHDELQYDVGDYVYRKSRLRRVTNDSESKEACS